MVHGALIALGALAGCGRLGIDPLLDALSDASGPSAQLHRGTCVLPAGATSVSCPIAPPQLEVAHTALFFQATGDGDTPGGFDIRCVLAGTATVTCDRQAVTSTVTIAWQTVERADLAVQHVRLTCDQVTAFTQPIVPVNPANAFVLGSWTQAGSFLNDDDFLTLELSASSVVLTTGSSDACGISGVSPMQGAIEVIELAGVSVTRGTVGPIGAGNNALILGGLPPVNPASTALLFSYRSVSNDVPVCELMVRGEVTSPTALSFSRGMGDASCVGSTIEAISWERIDFGMLATVQPFTIDLGPATAAASVPISTVDVARSLVLSTAQGVNGQATGEGNASTSGLGGEQTATMSLSADAVSVTRGAATASARFSGEVIEWNP